MIDAAIDFERLADQFRYEKRIAKSRRRINDSLRQRIADAPETIRIKSGQRIATDVPVGIQPAIQPDRIAFQK